MPSSLLSEAAQTFLRSKSSAKACTTKPELLSAETSSSLQQQHNRAQNTRSALLSQPNDIEFDAPLNAPLTCALCNISAHDAVPLTRRTASSLVSSARIEMSTEETSLQKVHFTILYNTTFLV